MKHPIQPYSDEELALPEDMEGYIESLMKFFDESGINYDKFDPNSVPKLDFSKKEAYPNMDVYQYVPGQHDTQKWLQAISDIYRKERSGESRIKAIRAVVAGWNVMETYDFLNWVKFHEAGDHMKYKFAQLWFEQSGSSQKWYHNPDTGYALPIKKEPEAAGDVAPAVAGSDIDFAKTRAQEDADRRAIIEKQRNKIIGRLDSAEKLLRSHDGHIFSGKEFETLLEAIYQLKKKIQMVNKISSSTRLYEDMIVREANVLTKRGFTKAADLLYSVAQTPAAGAEKAEGTDAPTNPPMPAPPADPSGAGNPGPPSGGAATPAQPPGNAMMPQSEPANTQPKGISEFLARMDDGMYAPDEQQNSEDDLEVSDPEEPLLVTEAQVLPEEIGDSTKPAPLDPAPVAAPTAPKPAPKRPAGPPAGEEPLEVTEDDIKSTPKPTPSTTDFDAKVDAVFSNITVADVVAKLEDLAKIFKTREVPRQLGIVDMMLDSLGLASYFPSLSEATNKALESNNYISTRVEDILSKLRGSMGTNEVDLKGKDVDRPEVAGIKGKLQEDADKEVARKKMRKEQETAELAGAGKETPEVEIQEDLAAPPTPAAPAAPPKAPPAI